MIFKIGDKVRIRKDLTAGKGYFMADGFHYCIAQRRMCEMAGETVTIESVHPGYYLVKESTACWTDAMFEKVTKESTTSVANFESGDIVRCIRSDNNPMVIGEEGVVICETVGNEDNSVLVEFKSFVDGHDGNGRGRRGHCWSCSPSQLRLIDRVKKSKFKIGDRVKYNDGRNPKIAGKVGTVIAHAIVLGKPLVEFDEYIDGHNGRSRADHNGKDGHCWYCYDSELEKISEEKQDTDIVLLKVGERVKYVGNQHPVLKGNYGTVIGKCRFLGTPLVEFDVRFADGHDGNESTTCRGRDGFCWYCGSNELEIVADAQPDNETITNEQTDIEFNQKIVITSNGEVSMATLYDGEKEICTATAAMPDGVDFDFLGCSKRALKRLANMHSAPKSPEVVPPLFNGTLVCIENMLGKDAFTIGKTYNAVDGVVIDDNGNRYEPINWLNDDPTSGFCVCDTYEGRVAKFVVLADNTKTE